MRSFPGKFFELRLSHMRPHELASLSRLGVRAFILLLFGAGGRAFGQEPGQARHYVSFRLFPESGKDVVRTGPPIPVLFPLPYPQLSTFSRPHTQGGDIPQIEPNSGRQLLCSTLSLGLRSRFNFPTIPRTSLNGLRLVITRYPSSQGAWEARI